MIDCTTEMTGLTRVIRLGFIDLQKVFAMGRVRQFGVDEEALVVVSLLGLLGDTARNLSLASAAGVLCEANLKHGVDPENRIQLQQLTLMATFQLAEPCMK